MNPILISIPTTIETPRLILRAPQIGDGAAVNEAILESFVELNRWMPWAQTPPTLNDSEENIRRAVANWILRDDLRILVFEKTTGKLVGSSGLHRIKWQIPAMEIGYWGRTSTGGQGYITEAAHALTIFSFTHLKAQRVEIRCDAENKKSFAIAERLGFKLEGHLKNDSMNPQRTSMRDTLIYARLNPDGLPDLKVIWS